MNTSDSPPPEEAFRENPRDAKPHGHPFLLFILVILLIAGMEFLWMIWMPNTGDLLSQVTLALADAAFIAFLLSLMVYHLLYKPLQYEVRSRQQAQEAESILRLALTQAPDAILLLDSSGRILFVNEQFERMGGYAQGEILGKGVGFIFAKDGRNGADEIRIAMGWNRVYATETAIQRQDGAAWPASATLAPVRAVPGEGVTHFLLSLREIASRKRMEAQVRMLAAELEAIVENSAVGILHIKGQRIMRVNPQLERLLGWSEEEIWGRHPACLYPSEEDYLTFRKDALDAFATGEAHVVERPLRCRDGTTPWCRLAGREIVSGDRSKDEIWIIDDITSKREEAAALHLAKEAAESASRSKSSFLANMSHELRSPMSAVIGMTDLVLKGPLQPDQREQLEIVRQSAESLLGLLDALLDFSRIEAGRMEIEHVPFQLRRVVESACETLAVTAFRKGLEIICHLRDDPMGEVLGDALRLRQILVNLLGNAIKFTQTGEVILRVERDGAEKGIPLFRFTVSDTGIGIPSDKLERIFDSFTQADSSTTRRFGGSGLGLAISRHLTTLMGGTVRVESEEGRGSRFSIQIPLPDAPVRSPRPSVTLPEELVGIRVLIAMPNPAVGEILREMIADLGATPTLAGSELETLARLRAAAWEGRPFDVLLQDSAMADLLVLADSEEAPLDEAMACPVILMLPAGFREDEFLLSRRQKGVRTLLKPVTPKALGSALMGALGKAEASLIPLERGLNRPHRKRLRILVAEDNPAGRMLIETILANAGHEVTAVENGRAALAHLASTTFDLALLDIHMPELDGLGVLRVVRGGACAANPANLPMAAVTADAIKGQREKYLASGFNAHLAKPYREEQILALVQRLAAKDMEEGRAVFERVRERIAQESIRDSDEGAMEDARRLFLAGFSARLEELRVVMQAENYAGLERMAQRIKEEVEPLGLDGLRLSAMELILASRRRSRFGVEGALEQLAFEGQKTENAPPDGAS